MLQILLSLQDLDLKIEACQQREIEIPKQRGKFETQRKRLAAEREEREKKCRELALEQRQHDGEIAQKQTQIAKYEQQLFSIKKNEEYQALLHEIENLKKEIAAREDRIIAIMVETDEAKARLEEDSKRIAAEVKQLEEQAAAVDRELADAVQMREDLERQRAPLAEQVDGELITRYNRIRASKKTGPAVVPLKGDACSGCHMYNPPQIINEVIAGQKLRACLHCGRLLYFRENYDREDAGAPETVRN
ncbi:MAG: hypothetical protein HY706_05985 [Candidatus Hydrogenedentes bacterium]|nr:hypothetical protein [Candidatus Hydrogenedentota bacterium]